MLVAMVGSSSGVAIPNYIVGERLGTGGFGEVFAARHAVIKRDVAIKVLHARCSADREAVAGFIAEARAVSMLSHPGIVELFELGALADGRQYFVMERLTGRTLRELLREHAPLPLAEALPILRAIAEAVDAAHAAGIAHRDLKPDNVFVLADGRVKLIDFGLAKLTTEADAPVTRTGSVFGTPLYMSPEQCRGRGVDTRTDAYSFGALAYHVLTGAPPWRGEPIELALHHLNDSPEAPSKRCAELPRRVDRAVLALLAKEPADRPMPLVSAVAAMAGDVVLRRRRRAGRWLAGGAALALVGGAVAVIATREDPTPIAVVAEQPEMCKPSAVMNDGVWDPVRRAKTAARFAANPRPDVGATWRYMAGLLDDGFAQWSAQWDTACSSGERRTDPLLNAQRLTCLERYHDTLRGVTDAMATVEPGLFAVGVVGWELVALASCTETAALRAEPARIEREKAAQAAVQIRQLSRNEWVFDAIAGNALRVEQLREQAIASADALEQLGSPMAAWAWTVAANIVAQTATIMETGEADRTRALLDRGRRLAEHHRFDAQSVFIDAQLAARALAIGDLVEARAVLDRADAIAARLGSAYAPYLLPARAELEARSGGHERALGLLRDAAARFDRSPTRVGSWVIRRTAIRLLVETGRAADAVREARALVTDATAVLGDHRATATCRTLLADALAANGELRPAIAELERVAAWNRAAGIADGERRARYSQASLAIRIGDDVGAAAAIAGAHAAIPPSDAGAGDRWVETARGAWFEAAHELIDHALERAAVAGVAARREAFDELVAHRAFERGDHAAMAAAAARATATPTDDEFRAAPHLRALAAARAGRRGEAERRLAELARYHDLAPAIAGSAYAYDALVLAQLGRWRAAADAAAAGLAIWNTKLGGFRGSERAEAVTFLGVALVELGELEAARAPLEDALQLAQIFHFFDYTTPIAQFALARALWPHAAERGRAQRLATLARDGFDRLGKSREPNRRAVIAWLADPSKPVIARGIP